MTKDEFIILSNKYYKAQSKIKVVRLVASYSRLKLLEARNIVNKEFYTTGNALFGERIYNEIRKILFDEKPEFVFSKDEIKMYIPIIDFLSAHNLMLTSSLKFVERFLSTDEFADYSDNVATLNTYNKKIVKVLHS